MNRSVRRIVIPLVVTGLAVGVVLSMIFRAPRLEETPVPTTEQTAAEPGAESTLLASPEAPPPETSDAGALADPGGVVTAPPTAEPATAIGDQTDVAWLKGLKASAPGGGIGPPGGPTQTMGSLDPTVADFQLEFSRLGAGIERITLSREWETADARRRADAHWQAVKDGVTPLPPLPAERLRHVLCEALPLRDVSIPVLAAQSISINGTFVQLLYTLDPATGQITPLWTELAPGRFQTEVVDDQGRPVLRITRTWEFEANYSLTCRQEVVNLTDQALRLQWLQYGPSDLPPDPSRYIDRRRFRFGYLLDPQREPTRNLVFAEKGELMERSSLPKLKPDEWVWPNKSALKQGLELSWFASVGRYFALAVHPADTATNTNRSLVREVEKIGSRSSTTKATTAVIFTHLFSAEEIVPAGATQTLDMGVFAGPLDPVLLADSPPGESPKPFQSLNLQLLILYQMSSCCAICTFQWLAVLLVGFLSFAHMILGDWGIAIILLVLVVRTLLHPLTKRAQINMHRFGQTMGELKPELEKLQEKYKDEPKRFQSEQLKLMQEKGLNPLQFLGCLPMFLQTPIWIALYAMLYFAWEIRQQPAFYGIFQKISNNNWPFLSDLSRADRFIPLFDEPRVFNFGLIFDYSSINILPMVMGILFFLQQKYMTPPPSPGMSKDQVKQQKIMKVMMVVMMPLVLYSAPSGLTLYILTSSSIGILEGRYVRKHIKEMDVNPPAKKKTNKKSRDALGRAYAAAMERAEQKKRAKQQPQRSFKQKRKK